MAKSVLMPQVTSVRCQHCGAPLQVSQGVRFITCRYCQTELEVVSNESTIHTALLQKIGAETEEISARLKFIEFQNGLASLDQDWEKWKEQNLGRSTSGIMVEPGPPCSSGLSLGVSAFVGVMAMITMRQCQVEEDVHLGTSVHRPGFFSAFMLGLIVFAIVWAVFLMKNRTAKCYQAASERYFVQRNALLLRMEAMQARP